MKVETPARHSESAEESHAPASPSGFARTPDVMRYGGPQMEDFSDWDSWYLARQKWVLERMLKTTESKRATR